MESHKIISLFNRYLENRCSATEVEVLMLHFHTDNTDVLSDLVKEELEKSTVAIGNEITDAVERVHGKLRTAILTDVNQKLIAALDMQDDNFRDNPVIAGIVAQVDEDLLKQIQTFSFEEENKRRKTKTYKLWPRIGVAAAIVLIVGSLAIMLNLFKSPEFGVSNSSTYENNIGPGGNKAILTLADGKTIDLSASKTGVIVDADKITYSDGTAIVADNTDDARGLATITTPPGGTYQITLPDGTKVWLNAASSLTYSTSLKERGEDRSVTLSGEAYFEVFNDRNRPFVVSTRQQEVLVLGTHFNINAYESELTKTTLLEGSVKVQISSPRSKIKSKVLVPGEQSVNRNGSINVNKVNTNIELAWKKGKIQFVRADLKSVLDMISRWYNIEVIYQYYPVGGKFTGSISRSKNISEVLNLLETTGDVRFKIVSRKVIVLASDRYN